VAMDRGRRNFKCCVRRKWRSRPNFHPNNCLPVHPAVSTSVSDPIGSQSIDRGNRDSAGRAGIQRHRPFLPDNAEVAGSIPASPTKPMMHSRSHGREFGRLSRSFAGGDVRLASSPGDNQRQGQDRTEHKHDQGQHIVSGWNPGRVHLAADDH
jgi:hypothetical protein